MRILGWYVVMLALAFAGALILQRAYLLAQVSADVDRALDQEVGELRQLAQGTDPATGEPFGSDVASVFDVFLSRNVPLEGEAIVTLVDGRPYATDLAGQRLANSPLAEEWVGINQSVRREVPSDLGPVRYLAVPLMIENETRGVFVVAVVMTERLAQVDRVVQGGALVFGTLFLVVSLLAWVAAGRVLKPLRFLTDAAQSINDTDWSRRIPLEGGDEIAVLGKTFNEMLDRLEAAFATQQRFVDDAGHELRTPITIIRGHLELLSTDHSEREQTLTLVTGELDRMARIVDDLLVLAKAEQPDFVDAHPFDLADFTREMAVKASGFDGRHWRVEEAEDVVVVADRQRLTQAVMNLARNASEHTAPLTPVALGSRVTGDEFRFWVNDRGPGIPLEEQPHIFRRFSRGRAGRRVTGGAGLGLPIVESIAIAHAGRVELDSAPGRGTTFTLILPLEPPSDS